MANLDFRAVSVLPPNPEANTFYFVQNGSYAESYLTTSNGALRRMGNSRMIEDVVRSELTTHYKNNLMFAADITARDSLGVQAEGSIMVVVLDASGDPEIPEGAALYVYDYQYQEWHLLTQYGTADATVDWINIANRPASSRAAIDEAVERAHVHDNHEVLDKLGVSATGTLTYNGVIAGATEWNKEEW